MSWAITTITTATTTVTATGKHTMKFLQFLQTTQKEPHVVKMIVTSRKENHNTFVGFKSATNYLLLNPSVNSILISETCMNIQKTTFILFAFPFDSLVPLPEGRAYCTKSIL